MEVMIRATLAQVEGNYIFNAGEKTGHESVLIPIPFPFSTQTPIYLDITANPFELVSKLTVERGNHGNTFIHLVIKPMDSGQDFSLDWVCPVFIVNQLDWREISKQGENNCREGEKSFLSQSSCVQSKNARIKSKAASLKSPINDIPQTIRNVLDFIQEQKTIWDLKYNGFDALEALQHGGSCISAANLATALLRANGTPARMLATHPTWFPRHQTHYAVEAFVGSEWILMDPARGKFPDTLCQNPVVAVIDIQAENKSVSRWQYPIWGVPYLSLPEKLTSGDIGYRCPTGGPHRAEIIQDFEDSTELMRTAFAATKERWFNYTENVVTGSAMHERAATLREMCTNKRLKSYMDYLSVYLD